MLISHVPDAAGSLLLLCFLILKDKFRDFEEKDFGSEDGMEAVVSRSSLEESQITVMIRFPKEAFENGSDFEQSIET